VKYGKLFIPLANNMQQGSFGNLLFVLALGCPVAGVFTLISDSVIKEWHVTPPKAEICENALDDDGDGQIDLNDPDCICADARPVSLIPNPSFEEKECCPQDRSQLDCAKTWIQASEATTDYLHVCGWKGWNALPPPLPFPDGEAVVGFRNGRYASNRVPNWKEYAGACLNAPMKAGTTYLIRFNIGFTRPEHSPPLDIVFYGTTDCKFLPFGTGNTDFGCPTNGPGWAELGKVYASGQNEWQLKEIQISPGTDIHAIAIGPDCQPVNTFFDTYYFLDNLVLADEKAFGLVINPIGNLCSDTFSLETLNIPGRRYQWFKEGVALVGETMPRLKVKTGEGDYQVRISDGTGCKVTPPFLYRKPFTQTRNRAYFCKGSDFGFNGARIRVPGEYLDTLRSKNGCDSIVVLDLFEIDDMSDTLQVKIFPNEFYQAEGKKFRTPGQHTLRLRSVYGCDSLVVLQLSHYNVYFPSAFSPNGDGINDKFNLMGGTDLVLISSLRVYDRWGGLVFERQGISPDGRDGWDGTVAGRAAPPGLYAFIATVKMDDDGERPFSGTVQLMR
jgi:gliding motility-associated-like protein